LGVPSPLAVLTSPIGSVLDRVRDAFDSPRAGTVAVAMLVVVTIGTSVGIIALGAVFDATVDQQITVDNPDRPPSRPARPSATTPTPRSQRSVTSRSKSRSTRARN